MEPHARVRFPLARIVGEQLEAHVEQARRAQRPRHHEPVAARHLLALHPVQRERRALTGVRFIDGLAVDLHPAHAHPATLGQQLEHVTGTHVPAPQRAGHHGPEALHREHAIDRQPRGLARPALAE